MGATRSTPSCGSPEKGDRVNTRQRLPRHLVLEARRQRAAGYTMRVKDLPDTPPLRQAPDDEQ